MAPKHTFNSLKTTQISAFIAASVFNEGFSSILKMMEVMGVKIGRIAQTHIQKNATPTVYKRLRSDTLSQVKRGELPAEWK